MMLIDVFSLNLLNIYIFVVSKKVHLLFEGMMSVIRAISFFSGPHSLPLHKSSKHNVISKLKQK